jgi:hypothetical protein
MRRPMSALTEEEAGVRWCPFTRLQPIVDPGGSFNRNTIPDASGKPDLTVPANSKCIASLCMAWRWREGNGFCGLAGEP